MYEQSKAGSSSSKGKNLGCIGKCTSGLSVEELDLITDHIHQTLTHPQGRKVFRRYLSQGRRETQLACLDFYEQCLEVESNEELRQRSSAKDLRFATDTLASDLTLIMERAEEMDAVPEIDLALLERISGVLDNPSRQAMLAVIEEVKSRLMNHLRQAHSGFRVYAKQPCPKTH